MLKARLKTCGSIFNSLIVFPCYIQTNVRNSALGFIE